MYNFFNLEFPSAMECLTVGKCAIDPRTIALSETIIYETRQLTYYILKIKELGYENLNMVDTIIDTLASVNFGFEYLQKDIENILNNLHIKRDEVVDFYKDICQRKNQDCQLLHSVQPNNEDISLIKAIMTGERQSIKKNTQISNCKKNLYEIMIMMAKTAASVVVKLSDYDIECKDERYKILEFLNAINFLNFKEEKLVRKVIEFAKICYELNNRLYKIYEEKYRSPISKSVTLDKTKGKAILISGDNFNDFDLLLQATEGTGINIYTHDMMLLALQYPYFRRFSHIIGQFQHKEMDFRMDFSEFPGPILLTKAYSNKLDSIYRGSLFSTDTISGKGITRLKNYDFSPLIKAAEEMRGFTKYEKKFNIKIGYNQDEVYAQIDSICERINENEFMDIYIVGLLNYGYKSDLKNNNGFFEKLYEKIGPENFIISLAYDKKADNILHIKSFFDFSLIYKIIERIKQNIKTDKNSIKMVLTQCTNTTLTNIFILKYLKIEDIYITCCNKNTLNPSIMECLKSHFNIRQLDENAEVSLE